MENKVIGAMRGRELMAAQIADLAVQPIESVDEMLLLTR